MIRHERPASEQAPLANPADRVFYGARTRMARVLIVTGQSEGGIWHYICSLANALVARGLDVALAAPFPVEPIEGVREIPIWSLGRRLHGPERPARGLRRIQGHIDKVRRFQRAVGEFHPDIVHLHDRFALAD